VQFCHASGRTRSGPSSARERHDDSGSIDIAEVHTEVGRLYLPVAIDLTSKFASAELQEKVTRRVAGNLLHALAAAVPYKIHTVLTDNGTHLTEPSGNT
jgi:hypothetical protein